MSGEDSLSPYEWNTRIAQHYFCRHCGIHPVHRERSDPTEYGVNLHCLDGFDPAALPTKLGKGKRMSLVAGVRDVWPGPQE